MENSERNLLEITIDLANCIMRLLLPRKMLEMTHIKMEREAKNE